MRDDIVGICRFSFLGKCDWAKATGAIPLSADQIAARRDMLYDPIRLARRFEAFEKLCLPSVRAQTSQDFQFWLLTSPELPAAAQLRLRDLCAGSPQIRIITSDARDTMDALRPHLAAAADAAGRPVVQFRVDDDDAFSRHHVARLHRHARRFDDLPAFAISYPAGLVFGSYDGDPVSFWQAHQPYIGAGVAVRMRMPGRSIYAINHFQLPRHFPGFTDTRGFGYVQTRWDEGDSADTVWAKFPKWFKELPAAEFQAALRDDFPFLQNLDLRFVERKGAA